MKKLLTIACICAGFALVGCSSDDDSTPTSQDFIIDARNVENGNDYNSQIDSVKAVANYEEHSPPGAFYETYDVIATANYVNGGFMMTLPAKVDDHLLTPITSAFRNETIPDGVTVTNPNAKILGINFLFAFKSGNQIGRFEYGYEIDDSHSTLVWYVYADRDVSITGSYSYIADDPSSTKYSYSYNFSLKKGWNEHCTIYGYSEEDKESTTSLSNTKPNGLKWSFQPLYN
ncbi:MAG: hypothetical protein LBJ63_01350 [Prevotellaceae bacterium]|jgi:hypothetical protein|nr:hypothetical protein [Prevotellaceae bacterium]